MKEKIIITGIALKNDNGKIETIILSKNKVIEIGEKTHIENVMNDKEKRKLQEFIKGMEVGSIFSYCE